MYRADESKLKLKRARCKLFLIRTNYSIVLGYVYTLLVYTGRPRSLEKQTDRIMLVNYYQRPINRTLEPFVGGTEICGR